MGGCVGFGWRPFEISFPIVASNGVGTSVIEFFPAGGEVIVGVIVGTSD
jgi:hypothetical protein